MYMRGLRAGSSARASGPPLNMDPTVTGAKVAPRSCDTEQMGLL